MRSRAVKTLLLMFLALPPDAWASAYVLRFGPLSVGRGGSNPLSIPPDLREMGFTYLNDKSIEYNFSFTSIALAKRESFKWGGYISLGGGLAISSVGVGPGPFAAFGLDGPCIRKFCFSAVYQQALGLSAGRLISPYSLQLGGGLWF